MSLPVGRLAFFGFYACALAVLSVRIAFLWELVSIGPRNLPLLGATDGTALLHALTSVGLGGLIAPDVTTVAALVLLTAGIAHTLAMRRQPRSRLSHLILVVAVVLPPVALSYRLAGLVFAVLAIGLCLVLSGRAIVQAIVVGACWLCCALPYDISARNLEGPPRFRAELFCAGAQPYRDYIEDRRVCLGGDSGGGYREPTHVWTW